MDNSSIYSLLDDAMDLLPEAWEHSSPLEPPPTPAPRPRLFSPRASEESAENLPRASEESAENLPSTTNQWDPRLILDLAIGVEDISEILPRYDLTQESLAVLADNPAFRRDLAVTIRDVRENGLTFRRKARAQAEAYLEVLDDIVYSDETPASTRLEAIKSTVKYADLEPKETKDSGAANQTQINVNISF